MNPNDFAKAITKVTCLGGRVSRRNNKKRRAERRERKLAYQEAMSAFFKRYPTRGTCPGPTLLNFMAQALGRAVADKRLREAKDPLKYDNILMERRRALYEAYKRNNRWQEGVDHLPPGWEREALSSGASSPIT